LITIKFTEAWGRLFQLLDQAAESHEPIQITGKKGTGGSSKRPSIFSQFRAGGNPSARGSRFQWKSAARNQDDEVENRFHAAGSEGCVQSSRFRPSRKGRKVDRPPFRGRLQKLSAI